MKLSVKGMGIAVALLWGLVMLIVGVAHTMFDGYGERFLNMMAGLYPGYGGPAAGGGMDQALIGALYGALDGLIGGVVLTWVYNRFARKAA